MPTKAMSFNENTSVAGKKNMGDSTSEDFLLFGPHPSNLFDDIVTTIDYLLAEEVASLPLLPGKSTKHDQHLEAEVDDEPQTGEEILLATLRKAYKKNIDLAEAYCSRNIFTIQSYPKTKRRKIVEKYFAQENEDDENEDGKSSSNDPNPFLSATTLAPPEGELPTPCQIMGMDKEILIKRQHIHKEKQRRIQLKRQLERVNTASLALKSVKEALKCRLEWKSNRDGEGGAVSIQKLKESVKNAMEQHKELKIWNAQAEEVVQILDKIKDERDDGKKNSQTTVGNGKRVVAREEDERYRKRMLSENNSNYDPHGIQEQISSLVKMLRGG